MEGPPQRREPELGRGRHPPGRRAEPPGGRAALRSGSLAPSTRGSPPGGHDDVAGGGHANHRPRGPNQRDRDPPRSAVSCDVGDAGCRARAGSRRVRCSVVRRPARRGSPRGTSRTVRPPDRPPPQPARGGNPGDRRDIAATSVSGRRRRTEGPPGEPISRVQATRGRPIPLVAIPGGVCPAELTGECWRRGEGGDA